MTNVIFYVTIVTYFYSEFQICITKKLLHYEALRQNKLLNHFTVKFNDTWMYP